MSTLRRVFGFLASLAVLGAVGRADAQTIAAPSITLGANPVTHSIGRTNNRTNEKINYADCENDDILNFSVVLANRGSYILQAWAGTNCGDLASRTNTNTTLCWKLFDALPSSTSNPNGPIVPIHVRDLLAGKTIYGASATTGTTDTGGTGGGDTGGTSGGGGTDTGGGGTGGAVTTTTTTSACTSTTLPTGTLVENSGENACHDCSGDPVITPISVYFMLVDGNAAVQGTPVVWAGNYKLIAPDPPEPVSADIGEGLLPIHFGTANQQNLDPTTNGYNFFCDPPPGQAAAADAGLIPDDAGDSGVVTGAMCQASTHLMAGEIADPQYKCGSAGVSATSGIATGLVNGVAYNVGVSATDTYDNVGKLSTLTCNIPQPVNGFFKGYRAAGGQGGGGFCSFSTKREPMPLLAVLGLASCFLLRRRRAA